MYNPTRDQVRDLFYETWRKYRAGTPVSGMETVAIDVILAHPEYQAALDDPAKSRDKDYTAESNPFLHMSLHMALEEQLSIDQPPGIRERFQELFFAKSGVRHDALHEAIECLAETMWRAQRDNAPPDANAYLECLTRAAARPR